MMDPRTLRGQLALAYAAALLLALIAFAALTLVVVDRTQRKSLDERLQTAARAISAITEVRQGTPVLDVTDRAQFINIVGNRLDAAVLDERRRPIVTSEISVPPEVLDATHAGADASRLVSVESRSETLRVSITPVWRHGRLAGTVLTWRDLDEITDLVNRLALLFALAIPAIAAFAVIAGSAVAARGLRPLKTMATIASEIEAHDLSRRLEVPQRDDELGRLCATFDRMLDRLEAAFARQRRFTSDASHELRAPLSVIRAEADLTLRRTRTAAEYERALRTIAAQADDLEALTRDILAAARSEDGAVANRTVDLTAVAKEVSARLDALARTRGIEVAIKVADGAIVRGDISALGRAAVCILHNALRYARPGGRIEVVVETSDGSVGLRVDDDGPGFSEAALEHATERFWRDDLARTHRTAGADAGGAGLGLSIARAIVESSGGSLILANRPAGGASVVMQFPRLPPFTLQ
jgi:signal transduction histidine kinase